ncbi:hypothetical protein H3Z83_02375 [Tenacibaculum sp. S7007]|uniref:Uncharacterized protein n=1 Tax=Tenacibaculum pelagium TaxID=2759527 RepID=A0A839AJZ4_9FLAO|nr:hypothetical protein [Tenacibaculum pelagium]MBA6155375.1 hypothetical protein [Tenacibaculum pelagium]
MSNKSYSIRQTTSNQLNDFSTKKNLDLAKKNSGSTSYYNHNNGEFKLVFPIPDNLFRPEDIFLVKNTIWILISHVNSTSDSARDNQKKDYVMTLSFNKEDILTPEKGEEEILIPTSKEINCVIYYDNRINSKWKRGTIEKITNHFKNPKEMEGFEPNDHGGGIIIKIP